EAGRRRAVAAAGAAGAADLSIHQPGAEGHQGRLPQHLPEDPGSQGHLDHPAGQAAQEEEALMLTRGTRITVLVFAVIAVVVLASAGFHYANLGRYLGLRGYSVVHLDLANTGGIFPHADVTYRGVSVGRVGDLHLTSTGVEADLNISNSAPTIPARLHAAV